MSNVINRDQILKIVEQYNPLWRLFQENKDLDWEHLMHLSIKELMDSIKTLSGRVLKAEKERDTLRDENHKLKQGILE